MGGGIFRILCIISNVLFEMCISLWKSNSSCDRTMYIDTSCVYPLFRKPFENKEKSMKSVVRRLYAYVEVVAHVGISLSLFLSLSCQMLQL